MKFRSLEIRKVEIGIKVLKRNGSGNKTKKRGLNSNDDDVIQSYHTDVCCFYKGTAQSYKDSQGHKSRLYTGET